ncbi:DUF3325 domain-containing protein [Variovorax sp. KK3]|uniref:DUF3325 domain-containing protein n=1 Tax=Variovorax sp. KK3 TaxID=1855728 RepID=UPI00097C691D|nr:DUF3325 domain-containing protein [Variovorax sp. KK3]
MSHLAVFIPSLLGFAALSLAMDRHQEDLFGRVLAPQATRMLRAGGWLLLLVALALAVRSAGWSLGLVHYSGHTSVAAGLVFGALLVLHRRKTAR